MDNKAIQTRVYPKTIADSVSYNDATVKSMLDVGVYLTDDSSDTDIPDIPINAQTLNGYTDNEFAKTSDITNIANQYNTIINTIDRVSNAENLYNQNKENINKLTQKVNDNDTRIDNLTASDVGALPITGGTITGPVYLGSNAYYINNNGEANFSKAYGAYYNDYAEYFPRGEETEPGDIIALDENSDTEQYVKATNKSTVPVGVHSDEFAMVIGGENSQDLNVGHTEYNLTKYIPVALCGRVYTKVIGDVCIGDYIIPSSIPGVGKAVSPKSNIDLSLVVGRALETNQEKNIRKIKILIRKG